jgi:hypothetical protein
MTKFERFFLNAVFVLGYIFVAVTIATVVKVWFF